jgi:hypothetical protein
MSKQTGLVSVALSSLFNLVYLHLYNLCTKKSILYFTITFIATTDHTRLLSQDIYFPL